MPHFGIFNLMLFSPFSLSFLSSILHPSPLCPVYVCEHWPVSQGRPWSVIFSVCRDKCPSKGAYHPFAVRSGAGKRQGREKRPRWKGVTVQWAWRRREGSQMCGGFHPPLKMKENRRQKHRTHLLSTIQLSDSEGRGRWNHFHSKWQSWGQRWMLDHDSSACKDFLTPLSQGGYLLYDNTGKISGRLQLYISFYLTQQQWLSPNANS